MLDMNFVRENPDAVKEALAKRHSKIDLDAFLELDKQRREVILSVEKLKSQRNSASQEIGRMKKAGENADAQMAAVRALGEEIAAGDAKLKDIEAQLNAILYTIPNMPAPDVPVGEDDSDNPEVRRWGEPRKFDFEPQAHWDIGEKLGILDFDRAAKVTGARFTFYKGLGSRLERAVINFFLDINTKEHGYTEMFTPFMANSNTLFGTGQLPKFAEDMFKLDGLDYYLIPTAEVTLTNYHAGEILNVLLHFLLYSVPSSSPHRHSPSFNQHCFLPQSFLFQIYHPVTKASGLDPCLLHRYKTIKSKDSCKIFFFG